MKFLTGHPMLAMIFFFCILLLGIYSLINTPVELMPDERQPLLTISSTWQNATAELVMQHLALPIEEVVMEIHGVAKISTYCLEGHANVEVEFNRGTDMEFATVLLKERLNRLRTKLPSGVKLPVIIPFRPSEFESKPFIEVSIYGADSIYTVRNIVERVFLPRLRSIYGIKNIVVTGGMDMAVKIIPDNRKLKLLGIDISDVIHRIRQNFFNMISVTAFTGGKEIIIKLTHSATTVAEIANTVISRRGDRPVLLKDVAAVTMGYKEIESEGRYQGFTTVNLSLQKDSHVSTIPLAKAVKEQLSEAVRRSKSKLQYNITHDESRDLKERLFGLNLKENTFGLIPISLLILIVIFIILLVFVWDIKAALLIFSSVFFSVFATLTIIYICKIPLNLFTLSGFILGFGMFVNNAVLVFDSIQRLQEKGMNRINASIEGPRQVINPILASTLTTIVVFFSFAYFQGRLRIYYLPVAITVSVALAASIVVAFILIPPIAARIRLRIKPLHRSNLSRFYLKLLRYPLFVIVPLLALFVFSLMLFNENVSIGRFFYFYKTQSLNIHIELPSGSEFEDTKKAILNFERIALEKTYAREITTSIYGLEAFMRITFPKEIEFSPHPFTLKKELVAQATNLAGVNVNISGFDTENYFYYPETGSSLDYNIQIKGYDYNRLLDLASDLKRRLLLDNKIKEVVVSTDTQFRQMGNKYFHMSLDFDKVTQLNLRPPFIFYLIRSVLKTGQADRIRIGEREFDVDIRLQDTDNIEMDSLLTKEFLTPSGIPFRLNNVLKIEERIAKGGISRENQEYIAIISWEYLGSIKSGNRVHKTIFNNLQLPPGFSKSEENQQELIQEEEQKQINQAIALALFLILLSLVVFNNSIEYSLLIMLAIPLSLIGVFLAFVISDFGFDSTAYIGLILLFGLVVNNAIIIISHINQYLRSGLLLRQAIAQGSYECIRPIFMTTMTTVLGALTMVLLKQGGKADIWSTLALCIVGGLSSSSILTILIIPIFFDLFWQLHFYISKKSRNLINFIEK